MAINVKKDLMYVGSRYKLFFNYELILFFHTGLFFNQTLQILPDKEWKLFFIEHKDWKRIP